jgi:hypothetical protein
MTDRFIIESFWQSKANCVSIALIKAAILKYGLGKVFKQEKRNKQYLVTLKNGELLVLSAADIKRINKGNKIIFSRYKDKKKKKDLDTIKEYVSFCFAIMVRNLHLNGYHGKEYTESTAVKTLSTEGIETDHIHSLLGLYRNKPSAYKLAKKHLTDFKRKSGVLLYSDTHIVVVSNGYYEENGKVVELVEKIPILRGKKANSWFELK